MSTPWHARWAEGRTGFHMGKPHAHLEDFEQQWLGEGPHTVLVPLAGKTEDIPWLLSRGHQVVAVELVPHAVAAYHADRGVEAQRSAEGPYEVWRSPGLTYLQGDIFYLGPAHLLAQDGSPVDRVWDRAAIIALPPELRARYAALLLERLAPGTRTLMVTLSYDQAVMDGPPFSVPDEEVRRLFRESARLEQLLHADTEAEDNFKKAGLSTMGHSTWLLER